MSEEQFAGEASVPPQGERRTSYPPRRTIMAKADAAEPGVPATPTVPAAPAASTDSSVPAWEPLSVPSPPTFPANPSPTASAQTQPNGERAATRKKKRRFDPLLWLGEILMTLGVICGLFAFWDVYATDWQVADFNQVALRTIYRDEIRPCPNRVSHDIRTDAPPVPPERKDGSLIGVIHVPKWEYMSIPIREGSTTNVLDTGAAGHYENTVMPGEIGNFSLAAHRRSYGSNFRRIDELQDGDPVVVETPNAWMVYKVYRHQIVTPDAVQVISPVPDKPGQKPTERLMTMTTCHPEYGNSERYIVHLKFDHWLPHDSGVPEELAEGGNACTH